MNERVRKGGRRVSIAILIGLCLWIVAYFMLGTYYEGFGDPRECRREKAFWGKLECGMAQTYENHAPYFRSLPSDEEMIAHLSKHRADFERLVRIYREDLSVPTHLHDLEPTPAVKKIMERVNVTDISGDGVIWMPPNPYSTEPDFLRKKGKLTAKWYRPQQRKFSGVIFDYSHKRVKSLKYLAYLHKRFYYVPFVPKMRDGKLIQPACFLTGTPLLSKR